MQVVLPTGQDVADFLGDPSAAQLADQHVRLITVMVRTYTRGRGFYGDFEVADDLAAVIIIATARLLGNPHQFELEQVGPIVTRGGFAGWNLAEAFVLNAYRGRAA